MSFCKQLNHVLSQFLGMKVSGQSCESMRVAIHSVLSMNFPLQENEREYIKFKITEKSGTVSVESENTFTTLLFEGLYMPYEETLDRKRVKRFLFSNLFNCEEALELYKKMFLDRRFSNSKMNRRS